MKQLLQPRLLIIVLVIGVGAFLAGQYMKSSLKTLPGSGGEPSATPTPTALPANVSGPTYDISTPIVVLLGDGHYLEIGVGIEFVPDHAYAIASTDERAKIIANIGKEVAPDVSLLRDAVNTTAASHDYSYEILLTPDGKEKLRAALQTQFASILAPLRVKKVLFNTFVMQ